MTALRKHRWTADEYLAFDRASDSKHEYYDGEIYNMVGGSSHHAQIAANAIINLGMVLRDKPCRIYTSDLRVQMPQSVEQDAPQLELYTRRSEGWLYTRHTRMETVVELPALEISLSLAALYNKVDFSAAAEQGDGV